MAEIAEPREYTKEELSAIYAHFKSKFTVEDLLGYIEDNEPVIPAEHVQRELRAILERVDATQDEVK